MSQASFAIAVQRPARRTRASLRQHGLTLIELMVAITIMLIVVAALLALFLNVNNTQREMVRVNRQIESGRLSIFVLENEVSHAGFWENYMPEFDDLTVSGVPQKVPTGTAPDPCLAYSAANWTDDYKRSLLDMPVQAYAAVPASCTDLLPNQKAGTDVLVVRHAETCVPGAPNCEADTLGKLYFQSSFCGTQKPSDFDLSTAGFATMLAKNCTAPAPKRKFISDIYYVRTYAETVGDGIPTLARSRFDLSATGLAQQPPVPLIEGIEGFRVELGLDTLSKTGALVNYAQAINWADVANRSTPTNRGDGSPDGDFVHCSTALPCTADQLMNVAAVKLYVVARSLEISPGHTDTRTYNMGSGSLGPFNDHYKRHAFTTAIRMTNVTGRRETP
ncbi:MULTISPECIES: PilW family protein [Variovorax]|jgi:type IV pilus assembly protein PilW|uniref:Putative type 4 fimbrial biogenesis PilW-related protein transmembrane n=1 Tax=Variovorax paradoxus (strain S110) TaxID=543728 RepID=C5CMU5_VARPS|nr:PilW family protein [Variovorax paradoxus]MBW8714446.1 PilW family protein [Variovorax paradoxus]